MRARTSRTGLLNIRGTMIQTRETYGIEIAAGEDEALLLAAAVAIDELAD
jgi:uncharacterized protein YxjI